MKHDYQRGCDMISVEAPVASQAGDAQTQTQTDPTPRSLEELRVKVAELCPDLFDIHQTWRGPEGGGHRTYVSWKDGEEIQDREWLAACAEFRKLLNKKQRVRYAMLLWQANENQEGTVQWRLLDASATAHCRAFVALHEGMK